MEVKIYIKIIYLALPIILLAIVPHLIQTEGIMIGDKSIFSMCTAFIHVNVKSRTEFAKKYS